MSVDLNLYDFSFLQNFRCKWVQLFTLYKLSAAIIEDYPIDLKIFKQLQGFLHDLNESIDFKLRDTDPLDQYCSMVIDEMQIKDEDFDQIKKKFMGFITLGDEKQL